MNLVITCKTGSVIKLSEISKIQGKVKKLSDDALEKMIESFQVNGFCEPLGIWKDDDQNILIAGNQRIKALDRARELGWSIPLELPCFFVEADNYKDAGNKLLAMASSYGTIIEFEVKNFIKEFNLDTYDVKLFTRFPDKILEEVKKNNKLVNNNLTENKENNNSVGSEITQDNNITQDNTPIHEGTLDFIRFPFSKDKIEEVKELLEKTFNTLKQNDKNVENYSDVLIQLLKEFLLDES